MATKLMGRSKRSGRATGEVTVDSAWLVPAKVELHFIPTLAVRDHGSQHELEARFAVDWAENWLIGYSAGWCGLHDLLDATKRGCARLPDAIQRMLLGIVADKALLTVPRRLGEHKSKTPPHLLRCVGSQVQGFMFDDDGKQVCSIDAAIIQVQEFHEARNLLKTPPSESEIKTWFLDWRRQEVDAGRSVPRPRVGRPVK